MARKRRRGGASIGKRQTKAKRKAEQDDSLNSTAELESNTIALPSAQNSSTSSETTITEGVHKKFGRFRCVIETDTLQANMSKTDNTTISNNTADEPINSNLKSFLNNDLFEVEEIEEMQTVNEAVDDRYQIIAVEENSGSSDQNNIMYIAMNSDSDKNINAEQIQFVQTSESDTHEIITMNSNFDEVVNTVVNDESIETEEIYYVQEGDEEMQLVNTEDQSLKITTQLSNLDVNEVIEPNASDEDSQKAQEIIYELNSSENCFTIECFPEEIVTVLPDEEEFENKMNQLSYETDVVPKEVEVRENETSDQVSIIANGVKEEIEVKVNVNETDVIEQFNVETMQSTITESTESDFEMKNSENVIENVEKSNNEDFNMPNEDHDFGAEEFISEHNNSQHTSDGNSIVVIKSEEIEKDPELMTCKLNFDSELLILNDKIRLKIDENVENNAYINTNLIEVKNYESEEHPGISKFEIKNVENEHSNIDQAVDNIDLKTVQDHSIEIYEEKFINSDEKNNLRILEEQLEKIKKLDMEKKSDNEHIKSKGALKYFESKGLQKVDYDSQSDIKDPHLINTAKTDDIIEPDSLSYPEKEQQILNDEEIKKEIGSNDDINNEFSNTEIELKAMKTKKKEKSTKQSPKSKKNEKKESKPKATQKESKKNKKNNNEDTKSDTKVRRSDRIKLIDNKQQKITFLKKIKGTTKPQKELDLLDSNITSSDSGKSSDSSSTNNNNHEQKPVKVKSRWRKSSELEMGLGKENEIPEKRISAEDEIKIRLKQYVHLKDNNYLTDRLCCKEAKKMVCDCFLTLEEVEQGEYGCGEDCLNRLLMIECGQLCSLGDRCTNKRFQKGKQSACEVFRTEKKGLGIRATRIIPDGEFILEYVGEVIDPDEFEIRATEYSKGKSSHFYFMALRSDAVIDATQKGNISRFINHSCEPNAETQKWTVNGELRIGFFSTRTIQPGEEITFDYHFQRYGKEAQKCFCEAAACRGWLGEEPIDDDDDDDDEIDEDLGEEETTDQKKKVESLKKSPRRKAIKALEGVSKDDSKLINEDSSKKTDDDDEKSEEDSRKSIKKKTSKIRSNKILEKTRKELFDDFDVNEEIQTLMTNGLKNQAHTLKLSRLMVRASEITQKSHLLRVLRRGELPCRRLFLDYHGLRLIHGWMTDAQKNCKKDIKHESLRLEILQTLATLPIPNKTMLQDSKVLLTVEKWSVPFKKEEESNSDSNSPRLDDEDEIVNGEKITKEAETKPVEEIEPEKIELIKIEPEQIEFEKIEEVNKEEVIDEDDEFEIRKSVGMEFENILKSRDIVVSNLVEKIKISHFENLFEDNILEIIEKEIEKASKLEILDYEVEIVALALKLLEEWSSLKEVFRIPKKERIERMKEHEREANRGYKPTLEQELEKKRDNRYRQLQRHTRFEIAEKVRSKYISDQKHSPNSNQFKFNKHERRKMFALQVEQEEEKRRKMYSFGKQEVAVLAPELQLGPHDVKYQYMWNPQTSQWQKVQILNQSPLTPSPKQIFPHHPAAGAATSNQSAARLPYPFNSYSSGNHQQLPPGVPNLQSPVPNPNLSQTSTLLPSGAVVNPSLPNNTPVPITSNAEEDKEEDISEVKFAGPIPPPAKLPPRWKCAKDKYGRPYYYHVKIRVSQWEPPDLSIADLSEDESSSVTSSSESSVVSSDSSEDSNSDEDDLDDTRLMIEIKRNLNNIEPKTETNQADNNMENSQKEQNGDDNLLQVEKKTTLEERLELEFNLKEDKEKEPPIKRRRSGLVTEVHIISPRTEEDKILAKENIKKYKDNKEKLKRQKELLQKKLKKTKDTEQPKKRIKVTVKSSKPKKERKKEEKLMEVDNDTAKKIKETFRSSMATVMVGILNPFRKPDCKEGRITNNEDFKHLARKLTHFVMLKELKHCKSIEDLTCTDSVKNKAKEFVRKYMAKFGENYVKPKDEVDF